MAGGHEMAVDVDSLITSSSLPTTIISSSSKLPSLSQSQSILKTISIKKDIALLNKEFTNPANANTNADANVYANSNSNSSYVVETPESSSRSFGEPLIKVNLLAPAPASLAMLSPPIQTPLQLSKNIPKNPKRNTPATPLQSLREITLVQRTSTSLKITWPPLIQTSKNAYVTVGYLIAISRVGFTGFIPCVQNTGADNSGDKEKDKEKDEEKDAINSRTFCAINLIPGNVYKFQVTSLSSTRKGIASAVMCIPKSSIISIDFTTQVKVYLFKWSFEEEKDALRVWRCYDGSFVSACNNNHHGGGGGYVEDAHQKINTNDNIIATHSTYKPHTGISSLLLTYHSTTSVGGSFLDSFELKDSTLTILRAYVYTEWYTSEYEVFEKRVLRFGDYLFNLEGVQKDMDGDGGLVEVRRKFRLKKGRVKVVKKIGGGRRGSVLRKAKEKEIKEKMKEKEKVEGEGEGEGAVKVIEVERKDLIEVERKDPRQDEEEPQFVTIVTKRNTKPPTVMPRLAVHTISNSNDDKNKYIKTSPQIQPTEIPPKLNQWNLLEVTVTGNTSNRAQMAIHTEPGFKGNVYIDDIEVLYGGKTEIDGFVDCILDACDQPLIPKACTEMTMRISLLDGRNLASVDFGGASDPYAMLYFNNGEDGGEGEKLIGKSEVVMVDLDPVWNMEDVVVTVPIGGDDDGDGDGDGDDVVVIRDVNEEFEAYLNNKNESTDSANALFEDAFKFESDRYNVHHADGKSKEDASNTAKLERQDMLAESKDKETHTTSTRNNKPSNSNQYSLTIVINDKDYIGSDDYMGSTTISKSQLLQCGLNNCKTYFPITGEIGTGRNKRDATGEVGLIVRVHSWFNDGCFFGGMVKDLIIGAPDVKLSVLNALFTMLNNTSLTTEQRLDQVNQLMQEPIIPELIHMINNQIYTVTACAILILILGDKNITRKTWGMKLRRKLQTYMCTRGCADVCTEVILNFDNDDNNNDNVDVGGGCLKRKAACLEMMVGLFEEHCKLICKCVEGNERVLVASVAGLEFIEREYLSGHKTRGRGKGRGTGRGTGNDDRDASSRIKKSSRILLSTLQIQNTDNKNSKSTSNSNSTLLKALWRIRRHIPLENGLWRSPALHPTSKFGMSDMPGLDELSELTDSRQQRRKMRNKVTWSKVMYTRVFWYGIVLRFIAILYPVIIVMVGSSHSDDNCSGSLSTLLIIDGVLLILIVTIVFSAEYTIRILSINKSAFVFMLLLLVLIMIHVIIWSIGFDIWDKSHPSIDFRQPLYNINDIGQETETLLGSPAPSAAPFFVYEEFEGVGCQTGLLSVFMTIQLASGSVVFVVVVVGLCMIFDNRGGRAQVGLSYYVDSDERSKGGEGVGVNDDEVDDGQDLEVAQ